MEQQLTRDMLIGTLRAIYGRVGLDKGIIHDKEEFIFYRDNLISLAIKNNIELTDLEAQEMLEKEFNKKFIDYTYRDPAKVDDEIKKQQELKAKIVFAEAYEHIISVLKNYLDTTEQNYKIIAVWILGTYLHDQFNTYPYLFFNAMRGSGKTRGLKLISSLSSGGDGSVQNNLTEAVLFRIPQGTTTCIDEVEQINNKEKQTLRELLNSAYKKGMKVKRMKKTKQKNPDTGQLEEVQIAEVFEPYFPICMANIYGVEEVLADRSIVLILEKSNNPATTMKIEDFDKSVVISDIKRTLTRERCSLCSVVTRKNLLYRWNDYINNRYNYTTTLNTLSTQNNITTTPTEKLNELEIESLFNKVHDMGISGRNFELLFPLILTAELIGEEVFDEFLKIAAAVVETKKEDEYSNSKDVSVYEFISTLDINHDQTSIKDLTNQFRTFSGESDNEDAWLNDKWFGRAIKRLNLIKFKKRYNSGVYVKLDVLKAKEKLKIFKVVEEKEVVKI